MQEAGNEEDKGSLSVESLSEGLGVSLKLTCGEEKTLKVYSHHKCQRELKSSFATSLKNFAVSKTQKPRMFSGRVIPHLA